MKDLGAHGHVLLDDFSHFEDIDIGAGNCFSQLVVGRRQAGQGTDLRDEILEGAVGKNVLQGGSLNKDGFKEFRIAGFC